jgi:hypothetical protein
MQAPPRFGKMKYHLVAILAVSTSVAALGQYSIGWYKVGGGGSSSTDGQFSLSGTIGHAAASAPMNSDGYAISGGFWALYAIQTPGAPRLTILLTPTNTIAVSWPATPAGFELQQSSDLTPANWVTPSEPVNENGVNRFIIVNPSAGDRFYRLKHP